MHRVAQTGVAVKNFNPRSLHGERPTASSKPSTSSDFNPRSLHGERRNSPRMWLFMLISIHAPCTGSDDFANIERKIDNVFQSTLPARGATIWQVDQ